MSKVGTGIEADIANWTFAGDVHQNFDEHINQSIPYYGDCHELGLKIGDYFLADGSLSYDLGCSTGTFLGKLAQRNRNKRARFVGIDSVNDMVQAAKVRLSALESVSVVCDDLVAFPFETADFITSYYTIQFVRPAQRQVLFDGIYNSLNWGGGFLWFEKVRASDARFQDMMAQLYVDFKIDQGFNSDEIIGKSRSIKGVLEPFSTQGNIDLAKRAGFTDIISVFKYVCFEGFLAIK